MAAMKKSKKIFRIFFTSYLLVLVFPMLLFLYTYQQNIRVLQENALNIGESALSNSILWLEQQCKELENYAFTLSYDQSVQSLSTRENLYIDKSTPYLMNDVRNQIQMSSVHSTFFNNMFVYFNKADVVITAKGAHSSLNNFYNTFFRYGDMDAESFHKVMETNYFQEYFPSDDVIFGWESTPSKALLMMKSFPPVGTPKGQIVFSVSEEQILNSLNGVIQEWQGKVYILDEEKELLYCSNREDAKNFKAEQQTLLNIQDGQPYTLNGEQNLCIQKTSEAFGWSYVLQLPQKQIYAETLASRKLLIIYGVAVVVTGMVIALLFAWKNSRPLVKLSALVGRWLKEEEVFADTAIEMQDLNDSVQKLYENSRYFRASLQRQIPLMRMTFVEQLLNCHGFQAEELHWYQQQLHFKPLQGMILVLQAHFNLSAQEKNDSLMETINMSKVSCEKMLSTTYQTDIYYYDNSFEQRIMILGFGENRDQEAVKDSLNGKLTEFAERIYQDFQIMVSFAAGSFVEDYTDINKSAIQAQECMNTLLLDRNTVVLWQGDLLNRGRNYYYPIQIEAQLIQSVLSGKDLEGLSAVINSIFEENFTERQIVSSAADCLFYEMKGTLLKILTYLEAVDQEEIERGIIEVTRCGDAECYFRYFHQQLLLMIERLHQNKEKQSNGMIEKIKSYVYENFTNPQLNLNDVAHHFELNPSYMSQLFKEHTHVNFSNYLEDLRIEAACGHLRADIPINQVAEMVGYNSVYVFRNAFKRKIGIPPSSYREKN